MKPKDWNKLSGEEQVNYGFSLMKSPRGSYIISQALTVAIREMKKAKSSRKERSNIEDMEILRDTLFPICRVLELTEEEFHELRKRALKKNN